MLQYKPFFSASQISGLMYIYGRYFMGDTVLEKTAKI
jgi:hypothetical protein